MPLGTTNAITNGNVKLREYGSEKIDLAFYFPEAGTYDYPASYFSESGKCIAHTGNTKIKVVKKLEIEKVETFADLMETSADDAERKERILDIFQNKPDLMIDRGYGFDLYCCMCFVREDADFFYQLMKVQKERMRYDTLKDEWRLYYEIKTHYESLLREDDYKDFREDFLEQLKVWLYKCEVGSESYLS